MIYLVNLALKGSPAASQMDLYEFLAVRPA